MRLLILDDHPLFAEALRQTVIRLDNRVSIDIANSTDEALTLLDGRRNYELLLVDIFLPGLDGFSFISLLRKRFVTAPVIVISATDDASLSQQAIEKGAMGFIHKSASSAEVLKGIRTVLRGDLFVSPQHADKNNQPDTVQLQSKLDGLGISQRQFEILQLIEKGLSNKEIARDLRIAESTVKNHVSRLIEGLGVQNRTACVMEGLRLGVLGG